MSDFFDLPDDLDIPDIDDVDIPEGDLPEGDDIPIPDGDIDVDHPETGVPGEEPKFGGVYYPVKMPDGSIMNITGPKPFGAWYV